MTKFCQKKIHWLTGTSRTRQVRRKANHETHEKLEQSAKKELPSLGGRAERGAWGRKSGYSACQGLWKIVGRSASCRFFPHLRVLRISTKFNLQIKGKCLGHVGKAHIYKTLTISWTTNQEEMEVVMVDTQRQKGADKFYSVLLTSLPWFTPSLLSSPLPPLFMDWYSLGVVAQVGGEIRPFVVIAQ